MWPVSVHQNSQAKEFCDLQSISSLQAISSPMYATCRPACCSLKHIGNLEGFDLPGAVFDILCMMFDAALFIDAISAGDVNCDCMRFHW